MPNKGQGSGSAWKSDGSRPPVSSSALKNGRGEAPRATMTSRKASKTTRDAYRKSAAAGSTEAKNAVRQKFSSSYELRLSSRFIMLTVFATAALAFATGRIAVTVLLFQQQQHSKANNNAVSTTPFSSSSSISNSFLPNTEKPPDSHLPLPIYSELKEVPHTIYSSKNFDTGVDATSDSILARRREMTEQQQHPAKAASSLSQVPGYVAPQGDELHEPAGQHLLVDIKSVDGAFLNSKDRLASAMVNLVNMSGLTMLSYHCHALLPVGVSCVGVLLESHISFHTWPIAGVITLDLFTCGQSPLLPLLASIKQLFGVPRTPAVPGMPVEAPHMQWAHKKRGFRNDANVDEVSLDQYLLGWFEFDYKELVVSQETKFQKVEIYDVLTRRLRDLKAYETSLADPLSYEGRNRDLFRPDRILFLDGVSQSHFYGDAAYHEALVHPVMMSHRHPKRVAIVGGGEGATLREVLKHATVETVVMVEIDEEMVKLSRQYLPEWSDCSKLAGSPKSCFEHPKAEVYYMDAIGWFIDRFGDAATLDASQKFDVIIMDALDPDSVVAFSDMLYDNAEFTRALSNALTEDGALVAQLGEASKLGDPGPEYTKLKYTKIFVDHLQKNGLVKFTLYDEAACGFMAPWTYAVAFKSWDGFLHWNHNEAQVNQKLAQRAALTVDGRLPFRYFDGAAMTNYQHPNRITEVVFCRDDPQPEECAAQHGYDPDRPNAHSSTFEVKQSNIPNAGRGLFATVDIPKGASMALEESVHCMLVMPTTTGIINGMANSQSLELWAPFDPYMFGYGFGFDTFGDVGYSIDPGRMTFMNHGCNNTHNVGMTLSVTELTADPERMPDELLHYPAETSSPFFARNYFIASNLGSVRRDIRAGEEILDNFLCYYMEENWHRGVLDLRNQCSNTQSLGSVSAYEVKVE